MGLATMGAIERRLTRTHALRGREPRSAFEAATSPKKPRLHKGRLGWYCDTRGIRGIGDTPAAAFDQWAWLDSKVG